LTFFGLVQGNVRSRPLRAILTAGAVAIAVMAVLALGVLTGSLKQTATEILKVGNADFTISQKHTDDIINSIIDQHDIDTIGKVPGVQSAIGALIETTDYNSANPVLIEVGLRPAAQAPFGVSILEGRSYTANAAHEVMLGYALARSLNKTVGQTIVVDKKQYTLVGLYRTNIAFGNSTMMFPLSTLQALNRVSGQVSLGFVKVRPGTNIDAVRSRIDTALPQLTTIRNASDYGRADRNLLLLTAANTGGSILAGLIAVTGVLNTSLLSFFERMREFGIYRAIGWTRWRVIRLVIFESVLVSLCGAAVGLFLGWVAINALQHLHQLRGIFLPTYDIAVFVRSLLFALVVAFLGALYPALRAAFVAPLKAMRNE
jgi:putative ABC transport system permease protein